SSEETGKNNLVWHAIDGSRDTRWCAADGSKPQWIQFEFEKAQTVTKASVIWESGGQAYSHKIEGSTDGKSWTLLADLTEAPKPGDSAAEFEGKDLRFLKITCTATSAHGWASIREVALSGPS